MEHNNKPSEEEKDKWRNDPNNWVWRLFFTTPKTKDYFS